MSDVQDVCDVCPGAFNDESGACELVNPSEHNSNAVSELIPSLVPPGRRQLNNEQDLPVSTTD